MSTDLKPTGIHKDSDSGRSDDEKTAGGLPNTTGAQPRGVPSDPDAGLSDEERAKIVRISA